MENELNFPSVIVQFSHSSWQAVDVRGQITVLKYESSAFQVLK